MRDGLAPVRVRLPDAAAFATVHDFLLARFPPIDGAGGRLAERMRAGEIVDATGRGIGPGEPYRPGLVVHFHRDRAPEDLPAALADMPVLLRDAHLLVVDKPAGVATMPRGSHIRGSALVHLRTTYELPDLVPLHRLDAATSGVLAFGLVPRERGLYQQLFQRRAVTKLYRALAPLPADPAAQEDLRRGQEVRLRIIKPRGSLQAHVVPGPPNSETRIRLVTVLDDAGAAPSHGGGAAIGLYELRPRTGRTHQLRVTLAHLGTPILHDPLYPEILTERDHPMPPPAAAEPDRPRPPLQLLATELAFTDPVTGASRRVVSGRELPLGRALPSTP